MLVALELCPLQNVFTHALVRPRVALDALPVDTHHVGLVEGDYLQIERQLHTSKVVSHLASQQIPVAEKGQKLNEKSNTKKTLTEER